MALGLSLAASRFPFMEGPLEAVHLAYRCKHQYVSPYCSPRCLPLPTKSEHAGLDIPFLMFTTQMPMNVTIPSGENCTSPSLCWMDGNYTWTIKNVTYQKNIAKCEWNSVECQPPRRAVSGGGGAFFSVWSPSK